MAGGGSGIGAATAARLGAEGAAVVVGDLDGASAEAVAAEVRGAGGRALGVQFDIADDESVAELVDAAVQEFGGVDHLHANAADLSPETIGRDSDALTVPLDVFDRTLQVNLRGHLLCTRHVLPHLLARGGGRDRLHQLGGRPRRGTATPVVRCVEDRHQLARAPRLVAVGPGGDTGERGGAGPGPHPHDGRDHRAQIHRGTRWGSGGLRLGRPDDIAAMVAFLMSDDGEWINGQVLSVDGGASLRP